MQRNKKKVWAYLYKQKLFLTKEVNYIQSTITIIFHEVKIKIPIKDLRFNSIDNIIFKISQNISRKITEKVITDIDKYLKDKRKNAS